MDTSLFCETVITIPQNETTCWFNTILMSIFYSEYSRKLLINSDIFKDLKLCVNLLSLYS